MPKKSNQNRMKGVQGSSTRKSSVSLPLLFDLPGDLQKVHEFAFVQAMESAFRAKKQRMTLTTEAVEAGAIEVALRWERQKIEGKQGTNDPKKFRTEFVQFYMRIYPAMLALFETKAFVFRTLDVLTDEKRMAGLQTFARNNIEQIEQLPPDKLIEIEW